MKPIAAIISAMICASGPLSVQAMPLDLSGFVTENYVSLDGPQNWVVGGAGNTQVTQTTNGDPSIFRSGGTIDVADKIITGNFEIFGSDDDGVGFAFGWQNRGQMYLFSWWVALQPGGSTLPGMAVLKLDTSSGAIDPARGDFGNTGVNTSIKTVLAENSIPWERNVDYGFTLSFGGGQFDIEISDGASQIANFSIANSSFLDGDFGFFNSSQAGVTYSNLQVAPQDTPIDPVPLPGGVYLMASGVAAAAFLKWRKNS